MGPQGWSAAAGGGALSSSGKFLQTPHVGHFRDAWQECKRGVLDLGLGSRSAPLWGTKLALPSRAYEWGGICKHGQE